MLLAQISVQTGLGTLIGFLLGICLCAIVYQMIARTRAKTIKEDLERQLDGAKKEAENIIKAAQLAAAEEAIKKKEQFTAEADKIRAELHEAEVRIMEARERGQ